MQLKPFFASLVRLSVFVVGGVLLVSGNVFGLHSLGFVPVCPWWVVKSPREISFSFNIAFVGGVLLVSAKVFGLRSLGFVPVCPWWVVKSPREISFSFKG